MGKSLAAALLAGIGSAACASAANTFYARPGDDLEALRDRVRAERPGTAERVTVNLAPGTYRLSRPLAFGPADGNAVWRAQGGRAEITALVELKGWTTNRVNGAVCWCVTPPKSLWKMPVTQLFVNGCRRARAHLPRCGYYRFAGAPEEELKSPKAKQPFSGSMSAIAAEGQFADFHDLAQVEVLVPDYWYDNHLRVKSYDAATRTVRFEARGRTRYWNDETDRPSRYRINNVREGCTEGGDWYYDRASAVLSYIPMPDERLETARIEIPAASRVVCVKGAEGLRFEFLGFSGMDWEFPRTQPCSSQAQRDVPAAVAFVGATNCALYACGVHAVAGYGVGFDRASRDCRVVACSLRDLGAGGVRIEGDGIEVADSAIFDGGLLFLSACGIWAADVERTKIVRNHIHHFRYSGVSCGWTWGYGPNRARLNRIERNRIHDIGLGQLSDMGGIYTLGRQPGSVVRGNFISDVENYGYGGQGIYLDEGSSWMVVESNVVANTRSEPFFLHFGRGNLVRDNVLAGSQLALVHSQIGEINDQMVFRNNLLLDSPTPDGWKDASMKPWPQGRPRCREEGTRYGTAAEFRDSWLVAGPAAARIVAEAGISLKDALPPSLDALPPEEERPQVLFEPLLWPWEKDKEKTLPSRWHFGPIAVTSGVPRIVTLELRNRGDLPGRGAIRFRIEPAGAATVDFPLEHEVSLKPGETFDLAGRLTPTGGAKEFRLALDCPYTPVGTVLFFREKKIGH